MSEQPLAYEEVPGGRTLQQAVDQPQRERIAYEELQPGTEVQAGDQYRNTQGRWVEYSMDTSGVPIVGPTAMARRPYKIRTIQEIGDALASAQKAATQLQDERDEAHRERDLARTEVARLATELWARKPLEDRVAALTDEVKQLREERQEYTAKFEAEVTAAALVIDELSAAKEALKSAQRARDELQLQVDELRADRERLQGLIDNLLDEPTAKRVYKMLEDMLDQTEWVGQCLDSSTYEQMSCIQRTISVIGERVRDMVKEGTSAND